MGPIALFDKSFLQSLSLDEAVLFDNFFLSNITPIFFAETLADLTKSGLKNRSPEKEVQIIAAKTPTLSGNVSAFHRTLFIENFLGSSFPMDGTIIMPYGKPFNSGDKSGVLFQSPPEIEAMARWQKGEFLAVERYFA